MSIYVLAQDGVVLKYPYSLTDMRIDNPNVSFPADVSDAIAADFNTFPIAEVAAPTYDPDTQTLVWVNPTYANGVWTQQWRVDALTPEEIAERLAQWRSTASCTPFQGRMALADADLLTQVETAINAADQKTKTAWEYALEWKRTSPLIATLAAALNLSDTEVDDLFRAAIQIQV